MNIWIIVIFLFQFIGVFMSSQYKENNFSTESFSALQAPAENKIIRPNINHLIKRILVERRRERIITIGLVAVCSSAILLLIFFQN